jgi:hypothetical protein
MHGAVSSQQAQEVGARDEPATGSHSNDLALAVALAQAARAVEHIVTLSAGRYGTAVTYGPGTRVEGIVLRRPTPMEGGPLPAYKVEAHIIVTTAVVAHHATLRVSESAEPPVLLRIASQARHALADTLEQLRPHETWDIDIIIDDLRDADAPAATGPQRSGASPERHG